MPLYIYVDKKTHNRGLIECNACAKEMSEMIERFRKEVVLNHYPSLLVKWINTKTSYKSELLDYPVTIEY